MTRHSYSAWLAQLAQALGVEKISLDDNDSFVIELDESRWVTIAYREPEDQLVGMLCLHPTPILSTEQLHYLMNQNAPHQNAQNIDNAHNALNGSMAGGCHYFALLEQTGEANGDSVVVLVRLAMQALTPQVFMQAIDYMYQRGLAVEAYLAKPQEQATLASDLDELNTAKPTGLKA